MGNAADAVQYVLCVLWCFTSIALKQRSFTLQLWTTVSKARRIESRVITQHIIMWTFYFFFFRELFTFVVCIEGTQSPFPSIILPSFFRTQGRICNYNDLSHSSLTSDVHLLESFLLSQGSTENSNAADSNINCFYARM